jgi:uncharacterized membrane protein (Fun14 family)
VNLDIKKISLTIGMLFLIGFTSLWAQTAEIRFVQRLTWGGDRNVMRYEIIIERREEGQFRWFLQRFSETNFVEVPLPPGEYRFQVIPYNFSNQPIQPVQPLEWVNFNVLPGDSRFSTGEHEIITTGPTDEVRHTDGKATHPEISDHKNQFNIYLGLAYIPLLPVHGTNQFFGEKSSLFGTAVRVSAIPVRQSVVSYGMEFAALWRVYNVSYTEVVTIDEQEPTTRKGSNSKQALTFDLNAIAQTRFSARTAINLRLGAGVTLAGSSQYAINVNTGMSFLLLIMDNLYFETGINYSQFFAKDYFGSIQPWFGLGYRF